MLLGQLSLIAQSYLFVQCASVHNIMFLLQKNICKVVSFSITDGLLAFHIILYVCIELPSP